MDNELQKRWEDTVEAKKTGKIIPAGEAPRGHEILWTVTEPTYNATAAPDFNRKIVIAIQKEKEEWANRKEEPKPNGIKKPNSLCLKLKKIGAKKASILLYKKDDKLFSQITENMISHWIQRENVPKEYQDSVNAI